MQEPSTIGPFHAKEEQLLENQSLVPSMESVAAVALDAGRMLMEAGASAGSVQGIVDKVARGLGADRVDLRIGYASLAITIGRGELGTTQMRRVGDLGVNQRMLQGLWDLGIRAEGHEVSTEQAREELLRLDTETPRHPPWIVAVAVGIACAAFGRLLGMDWYGVVPVFFASALGQYLRREFLRFHVNVFICTALVSLLCSVISGLGARWMGSATFTTAMIASILLLVPGVPAVNAQSDVLEGYPTLGSARAVTVGMLLVFIAVGLWLGKISVDHLA